VQVVALATWQESMGGEQSRDENHPNLSLVVQMAGICTLLITDFSSPTSDVAFWVVIGAGIIEVALALYAKRQNDALTG
jgi:hypothetical protein